MKKVGSKGLLISILSLVLLVIFLGCGRSKEEEKQKGNSWEQDMNKLIEKATPKEGGK
jgi:hypothetical protein